MNTRDETKRILDQLAAAGIPAPPALLVEIEQTLGKIDAIEAAAAALPAAMAQISAGLNPPAPRPKPLRVRGRKRAKTA